jgi:hypothetical protein
MEVNKYMNIELALGKCVLKELLLDKLINEVQYELAIKELEEIYITT